MFCSCKNYVSCMSHVNCVNHVSQNKYIHVYYKNWLKVVLVMGQWSWFFSICIVTFKKATPITKILNGKVPTSPNDSLACALVHLGASVLEFCWVLSVKSMQSSLYKTNSILLSLVKYQMSGHLVCLADTVCQDIMAIY